MKTKRADFAAAFLRGRMIVAGGLGESANSASRLQLALIFLCCCFTCWDTRIKSSNDSPWLPDSKCSLTAKPDESCDISSFRVWRMSHSCDVVDVFQYFFYVHPCVSMLPRPWTHSPGHCGGLPSSEEKVGESVSDGIPAMLHILHRHQRSPPGGGRS